MNVGDTDSGSITADGDSEEGAVQRACRGAPACITPEGIRDTLRVFRPYYGPSLTAGDAVGIMLNVGQLFEVLYEGGTPPAPSDSPARR